MKTISNALAHSRQLVAVLRGSPVHPRDQAGTLSRALGLPAFEPFRRHHVQATGHPADLSARFATSPSSPSGTTASRNRRSASASNWPTDSKTTAKLGELAAATLIEDRGGYVVVAGIKADDSKVTMRQQHVMKWAPVARELFHQFPAHLYVDGKFVTAYDYSVKSKTEVTEN